MPPQRPTRLHLLLDWDGTLTTRDTMAIFGRICANRRAKASGTSPSTAPHHPPQQEQQDPNPDPWPPLATAYTTDYDRHAASYRPLAAQRTTLDAEAAWLVSLAEIEDASVARVEASGVFRDVTASDVDQGASEAVESGAVQLREGWAALCLLARGGVGRGSVVGEVRVGVVSVNWSSRFIRACLVAAAEGVAGADEGQRQALRDAVAGVKIVANEIEGLDDEAGSSGRLDKQGEKGIRTSGDKLRCMPRGEEREDRVVVYVGDSPTDLECLVDADIGVCIRDEPMGGSQKELKETLERIGVNCEELCNLRDLQMLGRKRDSLWWAKDLEEVVRLIQHIDGQD